MPKTKLVGIVNITPDSFSDGGSFVTPGDAVSAIRRMTESGAEVIDIGAESTRPGATAITPDEEWRRLGPVLAALPEPGQRSFWVSVDTRHAATARRAVAMGVDWINDVTGFSSPDMVDAVRRASCSLVVMHSLGAPADPSVTLAADVDVISFLCAWAETRFSDLARVGIERERLIFDPGVGFGKTSAQSRAILEGAARFSDLGVPVLIGHSRKSCLATPGDIPAMRDAATLQVSERLVAAGVDYLRVHDVTAHRRLLGDAVDA